MTNELYVGTDSSKSSSIGPKISKRPREALGPKCAKKPVGSSSSGHDNIDVDSD